MNIIFGAILIFLFLFAILFLVKETVASADNCTNDDYSEFSYAELLRLPQWRDKRRSILERDEYKCKYCGSKRLLEVHHKYYLKYPNHSMVEPWDYNDDALITLCDCCHKKAHQNKTIKVYYTKYKH